MQNAALQEAQRPRVLTMLATEDVREAALEHPFVLAVGVVYPLHKPVGVRTPDIPCSRQTGPYRYSAGAKDGTSKDGQQCRMWQFRSSCTDLLASTRSQHVGQPVMLTCRLHISDLPAHGTSGAPCPAQYAAADRW